MTEYKWKVMPLSPGQLLDVHPEDIIKDGHFRRCMTHRGGGGYDQFPAIAEKRLFIKDADEQFVVQLYGCVLDCPYCYVTRAGIWGEYVEYSTDDLVDTFLESRTSVFHLMGGAPAIYMEEWHRLIYILGMIRSRAIFHSDLMGVEKEYDLDVLRRIRGRNVLYAIGIKGLSSKEFETNTRKLYKPELLRRNLNKLAYAQVPGYFTFTNVNKEDAKELCERYPMFGENSFHIDLINYDAMPYVDDVPWGGKKNE